MRSVDDWSNKTPSPHLIFRIRWHHLGSLHQCRLTLVRRGQAWGTTHGLVPQRSPERHEADKHKQHIRIPSTWVGNTGSRLTPETRPGQRMKRECGSIVRCNQARSLPTRTTISQLTCPLRNIGESAHKTTHRAMPIARLTRWAVRHAAEPTPVGTIFRRENPTEEFRPRRSPHGTMAMGCGDVGGRRRQAGLDPLGRPCLDLHPPPKDVKKIFWLGQQEPFKCSKWGHFFFSPLFLNFL